MLRLPAFKSLAPKTLSEAARMLSEVDGAQLVAGGTDLYPNMKRLQVHPATLVHLRHVRELKEARRSNNGALVIGTGITLSHLSRDPLVRDMCPALAEAALLIATPLLRNMGTLGGNLCLDTRCHFLNQSFFWRKTIGSCMKAESDVCRVAPGSPRCWAITSADLPPLLIALGAKVRLVSAQGERSIALRDLYRDDGIRHLNKMSDEILVELILPPLEGWRATYLKLRRRDTFDFPALGVAAALQIDGDGTCNAARIVLGAVTSQPLDMPQAQLLVGHTLTRESIDAVAASIMKQARPLHLADYTHSYRKRMVAVYVTRALEQLIK